MPGFIPRSLLGQPVDNSDPTYRMSMLPFGTYANPNGGPDTLGLAMPGMIQEPFNALSRLMGTPSQQGTFGRGPDYPGNADDMRTLLETFFGGNATKGAGAAESAATSALPESLSASLLSSLKDRATAAYKDYKFPDEPAINPPDLPHLSQVAGLQQKIHDIEQTNGAYDRVNAGPTVNDESPISASDASYLNALLRQHKIDQGTLFSDTSKPSLFGSLLSSLTGSRGAGEGALAPAMSDISRSVSAHRPVADVEPIRGYRGQASADALFPNNKDYVFASTSPTVAGAFANVMPDDSLTFPQQATGAVAPVDAYFANPMVIDARGAPWSKIPYGPARTATSYDIADDAKAMGHDGLILRNVSEDSGERSPADTMVALQRGTLRSPLTGETLFSDQSPSLLGAAVAGAEGNTPIRAYRGALSSEGLFHEGPDMWGSSSPDVASTYAGTFGGAPGVSSDDLATPLSHLGALAPVDLHFANPFTVDARGANWADIPVRSVPGGAPPIGGTTDVYPHVLTTDALADLARDRGHDGLIVQNVRDAHADANLPPATTYAALRRGTVRSPLTGETLFSDSGSPSLLGAAVAGAQNQDPNRNWNSLFNF